MELDELKSAWQALDRRLEQHKAFNLRLLTEQRTERAKNGLRPLLFAKVLQILVCVPLIGFFAGFWFGHRGEPLALASGLLMHAWSLAMVVSAVMELYLVAQVNYARPVLLIQRHLAKLRLWRTRVNPWLGLAFWLLWLPMLEVLLKWATGVDLGRTMFLWGIPLGVGGLLVTLWLRRWLQQPPRRHLGAAIDDSHAGRGVLRAQAFLDDIAAFERDE